MSTALESAVCVPAVLPYFAERSTFPTDLLNLIYRKLVVQDILPDLVHESGISEEEFVDCLEKELTYLFMDMKTQQYIGVAWLDMIQEGDCIRKGRGSFAFFREWQKPQITRQLGTMVLSHWFNMLKMDLVYGMTPASNRLAIRYCKDVGFVYHTSIPGFTCRRGELTDGMFCTMTREEFNRRIDG